MNDLYIIYYEINYNQGCWQGYIKEEDARTTFKIMRHNSNYKRGQLFDRQGKLIDEFVKKNSLKMS